MASKDPPTCPCCSNPWQAATGDFFAKLCAECEEKPAAEKNVGAGLSRENMDFDVHPKDNFFLYSNGNWMKNNPIPSGYPSWNSFMALRLKSQEDCRSILEDLEEKMKNGEGVTDEERKVALFYRAAMDEEAIEKAGVAPMQPLLGLCAEAAGCQDANRTAKSTGTADLGLPVGTRPPGNKRRAYFLPDDDDKDKVILDLGSKVQFDIDKFRREGEDGASALMKEKYRRYRECGLVEFGSARGDEEGSEDEEGSVRADEEGSVDEDGEEDNESSELTLLQWMEVTGLLVRDDSGALIGARGLDDEKREWLESLWDKIRPSQMLSCACREKHDPDHPKCIGKTCVNCSMWHWVSHRCLQMSKATAQREPWTCIECGGERVENAHAEAEERAAARRAAKKKAAAEKAAAEEAADDETVVEETKKAQGSAISYVLKQVRRAGTKIDTKKPANAEIAMRVLEENGWKLKLSSDEYAEVCNSATNALLNLEVEDGAFTTG